MNTCQLCHKDLTKALKIIGPDAAAMHLSAHLGVFLDDLKDCAREVINNHPKLETVMQYKTMTNLENALFRIERLERESEAWLKTLSGNEYAQQ